MLGQNQTLSHAGELDQILQLTNVHLVPSPGELLRNITSCLILAHWPVL